MVDTPIFLLSGTPGVGKSSVATALMRRFLFGIHIPVDDIHEWVVSGIAHPVPAWTDETGRQFGLARQVAAFTALHYTSAGFAVAIDDVLYPAEVQNLFVEPLSSYHVYKVLHALPKEEDKDDGTFNGASAPAWTGSQEIEKEPPPGTDPQKN